MSPNELVSTIAGLLALAIVLAFYDMRKPKP